MMKNKIYAVGAAGVWQWRLCVRGPGHGPGSADDQCRLEGSLHPGGHDVRKLRYSIAGPHPAIALTFSRNARRILPGYALQPSVHTSSACKGRQHARTCASKRSARPRSRVRLTTPPNHKRVDTIMAKPIQAMILHPFTRISSARPLLQVQLPLLHHCLMDPLTVLSRSITPTCHGPFVQFKRLHDGLDGTPIGE